MIHHIAHSQMDKEQRCCSMYRTKESNKPLFKSNNKFLCREDVALAIFSPHACWPAGQTAELALEEVVVGADVGAGVGAEVVVGADVGADVGAGVGAGVGAVVFTQELALTPHCWSEPQHQLRLPPAPQQMSPSLQQVFIPRLEAAQHVVPAPQQKALELAPAPKSPQQLSSWAHAVTAKYHVQHFCDPSAARQVGIIEFPAPQHDSPSVQFIPDTLS